MIALKQINEKRVLFFDTETAQRQPILTVGTPDFDAWKYKRKKHLVSPCNTDQCLIEDYDKQAGLHAEYSRIVCISMGYINEKGDVKMKTFNEGDERELLDNFNSAINKFSALGIYRLCGFELTGSIYLSFLKGC